MISRCIQPLYNGPESCYSYPKSDNSAKLFYLISGIFAMVIGAMYNKGRFYRILAYNKNVTKIYFFLPYYLTYML